MTHVKIFVGQQHATVSAGTEYAKTVKGNSHYWGMLIYIALVGKALP